MLTNRCLARTYVIYKVSYALLQLRQLAYKLSLSLWTSASAKHSCSLFLLLLLHFGERWPLFPWRGGEIAIITGFWLEWVVG